MREPQLISKLGEKIGNLPPDILLPVIEFYSFYDEAGRNLELLEDKEERDFSYGVLWFLEPAIHAIEAIQKALPLIQEFADLDLTLPEVDLGKARSVVEMENEMREIAFEQEN